MLQARAEETPDSPALTCLNGKKASSLSYRELYRGALIAAHALREQGVANGERVLIIVSEAASFSKTFFGVLLAGGVPVPLAPPFSVRADDLAVYDESLKSFIDSSGADVCVAETRLLLVLQARLQALKPSLACMAPLEDGPLLEQVTMPSVDAPALLQYTSGSTSQPTGVRLTHGNLMANIGAIERALVGRPDDVVVTWLPLFHDMGLIGGLLTAMYAGVPIVSLTPQAFVKNPLCWLEAISAYRGTITVGPNFAFGYCLSRITDEDLARLDLSSVRVILNGAEPVDPGLIDKFEARFAAAKLSLGTIMPVYGLAESCLAVAFADPKKRLVDTIDADLLEAERLARPIASGSRGRTLVSVGRAIPSQQIRIADDDDRTLGEREVGEICVRGPSVMSGYWGRPDASARALRNDWLHTGDLGYIAGGELFIAGRKKDLIIVRGRNYSPEDIELNLQRVKGIRKGRLAAFATDGAAGIIIAAETSLEDPTERADLCKEIRQNVSRHHALTVLEVALIPRGALPKSTSGKVRRQATKLAYVDGTLGQGGAREASFSFTDLVTLQLVVRVMRGLLLMTHQFARRRAAFLGETWRPRITSRP